MPFSERPFILRRSLELFLRPRTMAALAAVNAVIVRAGPGRGLQAAWPGETRKVRWRAGHWRARLPLTAADEQARISAPLRSWGAMATPRSVPSTG